MKFHINFSAKNECPLEYRKDRIKQFKDFLLCFAITFLGVFSIAFLAVYFW